VPTSTARGGAQTKTLECADSHTTARWVWTTMRPIHEIWWSHVYWVYICFRLVFGEGEMEKISGLRGLYPDIHSRDPSPECVQRPCEVHREKCRHRTCGWCCSANRCAAIHTWNDAQQTHRPPSEQNRQCTRITVKFRLEARRTYEANCSWVPYRSPLGDYHI
jgi:hypothetical protein